MNTQLYYFLSFQHLLCEPVIVHIPLCTALQRFSKALVFEINAYLRWHLANCRMVMICHMFNFLSRLKVI